MRARFFLLLPLLLAAACATSTEPYPYPPHYASAVEVPPQIIPKPPVKGSREYNREVDQIVAIQDKLTAKDVAEIQHQITITPEVLVYPVLGEQYSEARYPLLYGMLKHSASDSWRIGDVAREYWKSPRPWYTEPRVARYVEEIRTPGYPSGHTTTFGTWAYVLGDLFPAKRQALLAKAWGVGGNRIAGGAHYPHDIEGGKKLAAAVYAAIKKNPHYQEDLAAVRAELKRVALLPAKPVGCKKAHAH